MEHLQNKSVTTFEEENDPDHVPSPKLNKRITPTNDQYPIFMRNTTTGKMEKDMVNKTIYKLTSANSYIVLSIVNNSVDMRIREYSDKVPSEIYQQYLVGSFEYELTTDYEFEKLYNEVEGLTRAWVQFANAK